MQISEENINNLKPFPNNPRQHTDKQVQQIASSIAEFGFLNPILIDEKNVILAGHGRYMASIKLNLQNVPVLKVENLSEEQKQALVIADNKIGTNSTWNEDMLWEQIRKLNETGFDLELLAFDEMEILPILNADNIVNDATEEWIDMPEYTQDDLMPKRTLLVHFENEADIQSFSKLVQQKITDKTKWIWYPEQEEFTVADKQYE